MRIWMLQVAAGACAAAVAYAFLPGHDSTPLFDVAWPVLFGAIAGASLARRLLPIDVHRMGGAILAALGALALLLAHAIAFRP